MDRRTFITSTAAAAALGARATEPKPGAKAGALIDTNVSLGHWPTRGAWAATPRLLVEKLRRHGVTSAWAGNFDGVLHSDLAAANARLADECAREGGGVLVPFGTVNLALPAWEDDVRRCTEIHRMPGVRLFPNYHGYALDDPRFARLLELATQRRLLVQIALTMEDDRSQNPALAVPPVNAAPLADVLPKISGARVMLLNGTSRVLAAGNVLLRRFAKMENVCFEIATLEGVGGIETLLASVPGVRLAFGSHAPFFVFEAALLKLQESALTAEQLAAVRFGHAQEALKP